MKRLLTILLSAGLVSSLSAGRTFNGTTDKIQAGGGTVLVGVGQAAVVCSFLVTSLPGSSEADVCSNGGQENAGHQGPFIISIGSTALGSGVNNKIVVAWRQSTSLNHNVDMSCPSIISINTWYTVVSIFSSNFTGGGSVWVNGVLCSTGGNPNGQLALQNGGDTPDFCVGGYAGSGTTCTIVNFAGTVANFYVWSGTNLGTNAGSTASSMAQAVSLICPIGATAKRMGFPSPARAWPLYGASGSSIEPDLSGNGFNGTLTGTTATSSMPPCVP